MAEAVLADGDPLDQAMVASQAGAAAPASEDGPDPLDAAMLASQRPDAAPQNPSEAQHPVRHAPTRFQRSAAAPPANEPELTWGQTGQEALKNALPSLGGVAGSIWDAVTHPVRTASAVGQLGTGLLSQAEGALGAHQDPQKKARAEALANAVEAHYANVYGSTKGFKKALATDPASVAMDASTLLGGAGAAADAANLGRVGGVLGAASSALDPVANAARVASIPLRAAVTNPITRGIQSAATGVPASLLKVAAQAGSETDPALRATFFAHMRGQAPATDFLQASQQALGQVKQDASDAYLAGKGALKDTPVPMTKAYAALDKADQELGMGANAGWPEAKAAVAHARSLVDDFSGRNAPDAQNIANADALKQQIYNLHDTFGNAKAAQYIDQVYHGVKGDITDVDPDYAALMEQYQNGRNGVTNIAKTLGISGSSPSAGAALLKALRAARTPNGSDVLAQLAAKDPRIPYMIAGSALSPWNAPGARGVLEGPVAWGLLAAHQPWLIPGQVASQSPRVAGLLNYAVGSGSRATGLTRGIAKAAAPIKGAYYAGRASQESEPTAPGGEGLPPGPGKPPIPSTDQDVDQATRMVLTEAGNQPDDGKAAALYAFINRARTSGKSLSEEINVPNASESTTKGLGRDIDPNSAEYRYVRDNIVIPALQGEIGDPTGGKTHFLNKALQIAEGRAIPGWAQGLGEQIGAHTFYEADGGRVPRKDGGGVGHEHLVERLLKSAERAKAQENAGTKPLLKIPDAAVVKALAAAKETI